MKDLLSRSPCSARSITLCLHVHYYYELCACVCRGDYDNSNLQQLERLLLLLWIDVYTTFNPSIKRELQIPWLFWCTTHAEALCEIRQVFPAHRQRLQWVWDPIKSVAPWRRTSTPQRYIVPHLAPQSGASDVTSPMLQRWLHRSIIVDFDKESDFRMSKEKIFWSKSSRLNETGILWCPNLTTHSYLLWRIGNGLGSWIDLSGEPWSGCSALGLHNVQKEVTTLP